MDLDTAESNAWYLLRKHGLISWRFEYSFTKKRFGQCDYARKTITLSNLLVAINDWKVVEDVILHEIAHALVGSIHGHNRVWLIKAIQIGCSGEIYWNNIQNSRSRL